MLRSPFPRQLAPALLLVAIALVPADPARPGLGAGSAADGGVDAPSSARRTADPNRSRLAEPYPAIRALTGAVSAYAQPSVLPGEPIRVRVSTRRRWYWVALSVLEPSGEHTVWRSGPLRGRSYLSRVRWVPSSGVVRADFPIALRIPTAGRRAGLYILTVRTDRGETHRSVLVVRTPRLDPNRPAYAHNLLTLQAYNDWGGWRYYWPWIGSRVSFERPMSAGLMWLFERDKPILQWLMREAPGLQWTTDYDLARDPASPHPRVLFLGHHTEYVTGGLRRWVDDGLASGRMNLAIFGANSFYWRVRLEPRAGSLPDMVCYKVRPLDDPVRFDPTGRFRDLGDPEGAWLGSQYTGIVAGNARAVDLAITDAMPPELVEGTGWGAGTPLAGLLAGESDGPFEAPREGVRSRLIAAPLESPGALGLRGPSGMSISTLASGARVFDAGTFAFGKPFRSLLPLAGVTRTSWERFGRNLLRWLGSGRAEPPPSPSPSPQASPSPSEAASPSPPASPSSSPPPSPSSSPAPSSTPAPSSGPPPSPSPAPSPSPGPSIEPPGASAAPSGRPF